jgi:uncharacterized protein YndB with AHSA1/START domain
MAKVIRKEAYYEFTPQQVWVTLTDRKAIAEWLMPNNFEPIVGREFQFEVDPMAGLGGVHPCRVLEVTPLKRLSYTWRNPDKPGKPPTQETVVTWTLQPEVSGTRLILEHTGVEKFPWLHRMMMKFVCWGIAVKRLIPKVAAHVDAKGIFSPGAIPLQKRSYNVKTISSEMTY